MDKEKAQLIKAAEKYRDSVCGLLKEIYHAGFDKWSECESWGLADDAGHELDVLMDTNKPKKL